MKTKIFISYASEDETDFARPLADALGVDFDVWFAPYKLTMGDSLLRKISQGLRECDYGVVVLSPFFFAKQWPEHELDGLFGLETEERKVILPVWKDVTKEDVARYSPILAGRLSAQASQGVSAVVNEIKAAVGAGNRMASFSPEFAIKAKFLSLNSERAHHERAELLRNEPEGIPLARAAAARLFDKLENLIREFQPHMTRLNFTVTRKKDAIDVRGPYSIALYSSLGIRFTNCLLGSSLSVSIYDVNVQFVSLEETPPYLRREYKPDFAPGDQVVWIDPAGHQFSADQLAIAFLTALHDEVRRIQETAQRRALMQQHSGIQF